MTASDGFVRTVSVRLAVVVAAVLLLAPAVTGNVVLNSSSQVDVNVSFNRIASFNASGLDLRDNTVFNFFGSACQAGEAVSDVNGDGTLECVSVEGTDVYVNETGDNMTGQLNMTGNAINGIGGLATDGDIGITGGQIGVGTNSPTSDLDVNSNLRVRGLTNCDSVDTDSNGNLVCGTDATGSESSGGGWNDTGTLIELINPSDNVNATSLYIDNANDRVGVGTSSPSSTLDVPSGTVNLPSGVISNTELANSALSVNSGNGLTGGGSVSLGGSTTIDIAVGGITESGNFLAAGAVNGTAIKADAVTGSELASSVAGNELSLSGGSLDVDEGSGSGLNADLLDGMSAGEFENETHASEHAGTLLSNPSGDTLNVQESSIDHGSIAGLTDDDHTQYLELDGSDSMNGTLEMGSNTITGVSDPSANSDAVNRGWADSEYLNRDGTDSMAGDLDMAGYDVLNVGNVTLNESSMGVTGGNVGVGTSNPAYQLDVNGDVRVQSNLVGTDIVNTNNINTDAVTNTELASNAVTASGGELDSSVAGSGLTYNGGVLDVTSVDGQDASEFLELDGSDSMNGTLDVGSNDLVNVATLGDVDSTSLVGNLNADLLDGMTAGEFENESHAAEHDGAGLVTGTGDNLDVNAGTGLSVSSDEVQIDTGVVPRKGVDETISASQWAFQNDVQVQGNLDVWGEITNTQVNDLSINGSLLPPATYDNTFDLGNGTRRWRDAYIAGNLYDDSGNNFFESGCGDNAHVTGISSNGGINCGSDSGDISDVTAGSGLTGGASSGSATVDVGSGNAITVNADSIDVSSNSIDDSEVVDDGLDNSSLASNAVTASGGELDSSVAGSGLSYNGGALDVDSVNGFDGSEFLELDGSDSMNGSLDLGGNDLVDGGTVIWDQSNSYIPQGRLENEALSVNSGSGLTGGGSVSLGGSTSLGIATGGITESGNFLAAGAVNGTAIKDSSVGSSDLASNSVTSSNGALDSSVAGNELALNSNTLDVDEGSGSGLDADMLDGKEGSWYENETHADDHAGTLLSASGDTLNVQEGSIDHGSISGLGDDDHSQYLELDGSDSMNGTLDAGNNRIVNVGSGGTNFESDGDLDMNGNSVTSDGGEMCIGDQCA